MLSCYVVSSSKMENVSVKGRAVAHIEPGPGGSGDAQGGVTGGWNLDQWFLGFSFKNELKSHVPKESYTVWRLTMGHMSGGIQGS